MGLHHSKPPKPPSCAAARATLQRTERCRDAIAAAAASALFDPSTPAGSCVDFADPAWMKRRYGVEGAKRDQLAAFTDFANADRRDAQRACGRK